MVPRLVLASASPRRAEILGALGISFDVDPAGIEEDREGAPEAVVAGNARRKALAVAERHPGRLVLGADTEVVLGGRVFGQPGDRAEAERFLSDLAGHTHRVLSAICLVEGETERQGLCETHVTFRVPDAGLLQRYLGAGEWRGRAGGYAIQGLGSCLISKVEGDFSNVVGLPVPLLVDLAPELLL